MRTQVLLLYAKGVQENTYSKTQLMEKYALITRIWMNIVKRRQSLMLTTSSALCVDRNQELWSQEINHALLHRLMAAL